jgi:hypothetical protein
MTMSLFDADDSPPPPVREMMIGPAPTHEVDAFCRRFHYTRVGGNMTWRWGLWHGATLYGVVAYNLPTPDVCRSVFGPAHGADRVWHMGRLVLTDTAPKNSESRLIGGSLRQIRRNYPEVWGVITYAATDAGHIGTVYTGTGGGYLYYTTVDGERRGGHSGGYVSRQEAANRGWTAHASGVKHRYVYILGSRTERRARMALLKYPVLQYPKTLEGTA